MKKENHISVRVNWIKDLLAEGNKLVYFKTYLILLELTKEHGGNLPSIKACALACGKSYPTMVIHIKKLLQWGWIRNNEENHHSYTIVKLKKLYKGKYGVQGICAPLDIVELSSFTQQKFNAYLAEFTYDALHRYKIMKYQEKKGKEIDKDLAINKFRVDCRNSIFLTKSFITKNNKLRFTHVYYKQEGELQVPVVKTKYFDFVQQDISVLSFIKDKATRKECIENFNLKVSELAMFDERTKTMMLVGETEVGLHLQMSYTYRKLIIGRSVSTVKNYQKYFPSTYSRRENTLVKKYCDPTRTALREYLNSENLLNGRYIQKGTTIFYSHCTVRSVSRIDLKRK